MNEAVSLTRAIIQFSLFSDALCKLTDQVDVVDVAIDVAEASILVVTILANVWATSSIWVTSIVPEGAHFLHQT